MSEGYSFEVTPESIEELKKAINYDELNAISERFDNGTETIDDIINHCRNYRIKFENGNQILVVEKKYFDKVIDLYQKEKEKNKKMERKWDEEKYLIKLAENELLGYSQGYEDGFNHNSTAVQQIIMGRESETHQLEIERLKKIISKLKKENEELDEKFKYAVPDEIVDELYISKDKIREIIKEINNKGFNNAINYSEFYYKTEVLKELLEENKNEM